MSMNSYDEDVASWFENLPLSDPRCSNDSCTAFYDAHEASQAQISWASQFLYGHYTAWIYGVVLFLFALVFLFQNVQRASSKSPGGPGLWHKTVALVRNVTYRRIGGKVGRYLGMPSLGVIIFLVLAWLAVSIMSFKVRPYYRGKRGYGSPPLAVRTGLIAFALLPITIATAGKVNMITWITGIGHEKLNVFHRCPSGRAARRSFTQFYRSGGLEYTGTPAIGILCGLVFLSISPLRRHAYELFVVPHYLMAVVYLGLCFWHATQEGDSWNYCWATLGIWLLQIVVRWFGKTSFFKLRGVWLHESRVLMTRLPESMVRLDLSVEGNWTWEPGQHVFLRFLQLRPLDNHPFTIVNVPGEKKDGVTEMSFLVRPVSGITARVASVAEKQGGLSAIVDGPYGTIVRPKVPRTYHRAVLVAGGGGISGVLPWLAHLSSTIGKGDSVIETVTLIWAVRKKESLGWAVEELTRYQDQAPAGSVSFSLWVTGAEDSTTTQDSSKETHEDKTVASDAFPGHEGFDTLQEDTHFSGRPDLKSLVQSSVGPGKTMFFGCGPESLQIDLSNGVAGAQRRVLAGECQEIRLHTESFG